jgi:hypothetical protein
MKTTTICHFTFARKRELKIQIVTNVGEDMKKSGPSHSAGGNVQW